MRRTEYFVSMQKVRTKSEEFECWAFRTESGKYHLAYITLDGTQIGFMADDPVPEDSIDFKPEIRIFEKPFRMKLGGQTWNIP